MAEHLNGTTWSTLRAHLHRGGAYGYWWILDEVKTYTIKRGPRTGQEEKRKRTAWWPVDRPSQLPSGTTEHVYFGVHPAIGIPQERKGKDGVYVPKPEYTRPLVSEIAAVNCLFGEFDAKDFGEGKAGALAHIESLAFKPSALIDSGGGYHAYWLLDQPTIITDANREQIKALQARWVAWVDSDEDSKDLARVLRVPGRPNVKPKYAPDYPMVAFVYADFNRLYALDELAAAIPPAIVATEAREALPFTPTPGDHSAYVQAAYTGEVQAVLSALDGQKHRTLRNAAIKLAGLLWTGCISEREIADGLQDAAERNAADVGYAHKTIADGIAYGANRPRTIAERTHASTHTTPVLPSAAQTLSRSFIFKCLGEDEAGDAQLLTQLYRGRLVYDCSARLWYTFESHAWTARQGPPRHLVWGAVAAVYLHLAADLQAEAGTASADPTAVDPKQAEALKSVERLTQRAKKLRSLNRINNVLTLCQDEALLGVAGDIWDADPWLLGVANGVLNLRSGALRDGKPEDYIRIVTPTAWQGLNAPCPRWERFVAEVLSDEADRVAFLQRLLGYALNGETKEHVLGICVGERGRNGKRVLFETLQHVLGDYTKSVSTDVVIGQDRFRAAGSAQPHLMELQGRRVAFCSETSEHDALSTSQVKNITGGDPITARWLHANPITFMPSHTLFLQTNRKPQAPADDDALWERVKVIEFKVRFVDEPQAADERQRDPKLEETLRAEASGILAWLVRGGLDWQQGGLRTPRSVKLARDTYRKEESIEPFLDAACVVAESLSAEGGALYAAYESWCKSQGLRSKSLVWFGKQMKDRFEKDRIGGKGRTCYLGIGLETTEFTSPPTDNPSQIDTTLHNPSHPIETPQNAPVEEGFTRFCEGLQLVSKSIGGNATHEGKNMHNPSHPSHPSQNEITHPDSSPILPFPPDAPVCVDALPDEYEELGDEGPAPLLVEPVALGDYVSIRLNRAAPELYAAGWRAMRDGVGYRLISPTGERTGLYGDFDAAVRAAAALSPQEQAA